MDAATVLSSILLCLCIYILTLKFRPSGTTMTSFPAPPGPYQWPIVGNLHQVGKNPHRSFAKLAKTYGPLMSLRLGIKQTVVVSSAAMAREILHKNDRVCSSRAVTHATHSLGHHESSVAFLPPNGKWRLLRKICQEQIFANHRLDASQGLRQEKLKELRDFVDSCSSAGRTVNIGEAAFTTSLNLVSRSLFSADFGNYDSDSVQEFKEVVWGVMKYLGGPNFSDYFPVLRRFDPQRILQSTMFYFQKLFDIFDSIIQERQQEATEASETGTALPKKNDLLEALLDQTLKHESEFSLSDLKHLLLDLFVAAIDTTSSTVEWAMTELLRSPEKMEKARAELKQVIGDEGAVQESDISRLPYLQAVLKETFRLHPPAPFLLPHKATKDVEINGYMIQKETEILINVWASGRDEGTWRQAENFIPERFWESEIDVRGQHFELIPFGAGRRICPGLPLGYRMAHLMLASFIHNMHWKLEGHIKPEDLDMGEMFGLTVPKAVPLRAIPVKL